MANGMFGKYEVRGRLGAGAMGTVYDVFDPVIERRAALKTVRRPEPGDPEGQEAMARFKREAQAAGRLNHPHIVAIYDYGEDAQTAWIAMELVEGGTLKDRLDRGERFPLPQITRVMEQVLAALDYSHKRGVVHRDIKPANIMLTADGPGAENVKIADFGIARIENSAMTQVGDIMGTPAYMAPEQLRGEAVDARADIWAAGVVLYQLLTGEKPFAGGYSSVQHKAINTEPTPPSALSVTAPKAFDAIIGKAMAKRPDDRFASAGAFAEALRAAGANPDTAPVADDATMVATTARTTTYTPAPASPPARAAAKRKGPPIALIAGGGALLVAAVAGLLLLGGDKNPPGGPEPERPTIAAASPPVPAGAGNLPALPRPATADPLPAAPPERLATPGNTATPVAPPPIVDNRPAPEPARPQIAALPPPRIDFRAAAAAAAAAPACALLATSASDTGLAIEGVLRRGDEAALRRTLVLRDVPSAAARLSLASFEGPYCEAFDTLRPVLAPPDAAPRMQLIGTTPLLAGQLLRFEVTMPDWPAQLTVSYLMSNGEVAHLARDELHPPGTTIRLGEPNIRFRGWEVSDPFGTDLMLAIISDGPLFNTPRPAEEPQQNYIAALAEALRTARMAGRRVLVRPLVVETAAR